ncbi:collagen binding domain-containing protein [Lawsonibacter sp. JLR.KK007]|uniref:collagen binding domain-containing protein n=1 Tax=Lawsonibacter sp. JLR.KK007 TaxID=3114293 RepID=UPI002FF2EAB1
MLKSMKAHWKRAVSGLLAVIMAAGMLPAPAFAADTSGGSNPYAPTGNFEVNVAGATAWNGGDGALTVYKTESGSAQVTTIPAAVPFALLEDNGGTRLKVGYAADGGWTGSSLDGTGWIDKENVLVNLPDLLPSIGYDRDSGRLFNSRLTRFEYVIPASYSLAEQLAQLQQEAMTSGNTLVVRQSGQTVSVSRAKGDPAQLHSYTLDGVAYQKYDGWTEYETADDSLGDLSYELPFSIDRAYSADPSVTLTVFCPQTVRRAPARVSASNPTGGVGAYNPGSPGGKKPSTSNVAWSTDPERTFLRFTLLEFPQGVVTDLNTRDWSTWHVIGTPLNVVWSNGWSVDKCRSDITWYNSNAMQYNGEGSNAPQLMGGSFENGGVYSYDATGGSNSRWVTTADEFQAATGISDQEKEQMFHCNSGSWSSGWRNGDYTSMWGTDAESVTPGNLYQVYKANDAFLYLLKRLSSNESNDGWDADTAMENWSEYVHDADGNLRTKYRIIVETGGVFKDPDGMRRAYTLREMMAYSLYNNEGSGPYTLIYDQMSTMVNMARWMRQGKDNQFLEYPLDESGTPTGEELHSTNGFRETDSYVDTIQYARPIRDTIFSERRSFGLHIFSPFNFEGEQPDRPSLEVTKKAGSDISSGEEWGFTVKYITGNPTSFSATKNGADCTSQVTDTGSGLKFRLKANETIHIDFETDLSFRCEVTEDDSSDLTDITGSGGTADMTAKKFTTTSGVAKVTFTNGTEPPPPPDNPPPTPTPGKAILYKRDANTNAGVGPATFKFNSVVNGSYEFDTDASGTLESIQWWDPTEADGKYIKPGEYAVTEIVPPPNYLPTTEVQQIKLELDADGNPIPAGPLVFKNLAKVGLRVVKYDRQSHQPMNGVTFEIFHNGTSIGRYETKGQGEIILTNIEPGTYRAMEVDTGDEGHILDTSYQEVELVAGGGTKDLVFFNDNKPGMKLVKVDSANPSKTIPNAKFRIRAVDGSFGPQEFVTNGSGEIDLSNLPAGSYEVTEIECAGYVIDNAQRIIHLKANDTAQFVFTNTKKPGFRLIKTSADGTPLDGVTFKITPIEDASHSIDRTTANGGEIFVEDLEPGVYSVVETATLPDYVLDKTEYHVELSPGKTAELRLMNEKKPLLTLSKTDADTGAVVPGTVFEVKGIDNDYQDDWTTGADGKAAKRVTPGTYRVTEKHVPAPYYLPDKDADRVQTISLNPGDEKTLFFKNHRTPELTIFKVDSVAGAPIEGAKFHVTYTSNGEAAGAPASMDFGFFISDSHGEIRLHEKGKKLYPGEYTVTEVEPAPGFQMKEPTTQKVILHGGESKTLTFQNEPLNGIVVEKYDNVTHEALPGCTFQLRFLGGTSGTGGTVIGQKTTGQNGTCIWTGLTAGTYVVEEIDPADGYSIINSSETVYISDDGKQSVVTVKFDNAPDGILLIRKVCSVNPSVTLQDAEFKVTYADGTLIGDSNGIYRTDAHGEIRIEGLKPGKSVIVTETKAPAGFIIDTQSQTIQIKEGRTVSLTFKNQPRGKLIIQKRDSQTGQPLPGAEFRVTTAAGCEVGLDGVIGTATLTQNGLFTTDSNGEIRISNLAPGAYVLTETRAPAGYVMDSPSTNVVIGPNGDTQTVIVTNTPKATLTITKRDAVTRKPLANAEFIVRDSEGHTVGPTNGIYKTGTDGTVIVSGLEPGSTIMVSETKAPTGYILDETPKSIVVKSGISNSLIFDNEPGTTLIIRKFIEGTENEPLSGVCFKVVDGSGAAVGPDDGCYYTDKAGEIVLSGIEPGTTVIAREIKTVEGYILDGTPQDILIKGGEVQQLTFWNKRAGTLVIQKKDKVSGDLIPGAQFQLIYANGGFVDNDNGHLSSNGLYTTDDKGEIRISGIIGTVVAKEVKAAPGYVIDPATQTQTVTVNPLDTQTLVFLNDPMCSLTIKKLDSVSGKPVPGTEFVVKDGSGNILARCTTGKDGTATVSGLVPGSTVIVTETRVPEGYVLNQTPQTITVKNGTGNSLIVGNIGGSSGGNGSSNGGNDLTFENDPKMTLTIHKYIEGTANEPLAGVAFKVVDGSGAPVGPSDGVFYTDAKGEIVIEGLEPGTTVTAQEVKTVEGFVLDGTPKTIKIKAGQAPQLIFWNKRAGNLIINKVDGIDKHPLAGVCFKLTYADGSNVDQDGGKTSTNGMYVTDSTGQIKISGIVGTVIITEVETIDGYYIKEEHRTKTVEVNPDDTQTVTVYNVPTQALVIQKFAAGDKGAPLAGVEFLVTDSDGTLIGPNNGIYKTDALGRITIKGLTPGTVITAKETKALDGYILDSTPQSIEIKSGEVQTLSFYNTPAGGLTIIKKDEETGERISGVQFEIRKLNGEVIGNYTTDRSGVISLPQADTGWYQVTELKAAKGYRLDSQPYQVEVKDGSTATLEITNRQAGSAIIHKVDSLTGEGICGVKFLVSDSKGNPIGTYESDNEGYVFIDKDLADGKYTVRELECAQGYILDTVPKTFYVEYGGCTTITWPNTAIRGQIQIVKKSAEYNSVNGLPAGTLLEGATFEIYNERTGNKVDTIVTGANGLASSKALPLGRYTIRETKAPANYGTSTETYTAVLEYSGQIVRLEISNKSLSTGVSIEKTGPKEAMSGQPVRYVFSRIGNTSNVMLQSFYWRDTLPASVRLDKVVTGTYNFPGTYKIVYKVNSTGDYRTLADSLSTSRNYTLAASPAALGLAANERVTEVMFVFGQVPGGFSQVETPMLHCITLPGLVPGSSFVNVADVGGTYNGVWVQGVTRWVTTVYGKPTPLPRTGY